MNKTFLDNAIEKLHFSQEAREEIFACVDAVKSGECVEMLDALLDAFISEGYVTKNVNDDVRALAKKINISKHTLWLLICILAMESALPIWKEKGIPEERFWYTFEDLLFKARKCKNIYGVWGIFVPFWYKGFYNARIIRFGCFEFEEGTYRLDEPYVCGGITVNNGDPVKGVHIPASGMPFDRESRLDALRQAYEFFKPQLDGKPLVCKCHSWLLYPAYKELYAPTSNLSSFFDDFDILEVDDQNGFPDVWRVSGMDAGTPYEELPEKTSLQRAFKRYLLDGGKSGEGLGMFVFDGEKIIKREN